MRPIIRDQRLPYKIRFQTMAIEAPASGDVISASRTLSFVCFQGAHLLIPRDYCVAVHSCLQRRARVGRRHCAVRSRRLVGCCPLASSRIASFTMSTIGCSVRVSMGSRPRIPGMLSVDAIEMSSGQVIPKSAIARVVAGRDDDGSASHLSRTRHA